VNLVSIITSRIDTFISDPLRLMAEAAFHLDEYKLVLIKPNICGLYHPSIKVLLTIIRCFEKRSEEIVIGETRSMIHDPEAQFNRLGVKNLLKEFGDNLRLMDLSEDRIVKIKVPKPHVLNEIELPETCTKCDVLINLSKVGTHSTTRITNALKNLFGLLPEKRKYSVYHPLGMDKVIADIAQVIQPDLNITDAGSHVVIGRDALAVDVVACRYLGIDPLEVRHLRLVSEDRGERLEKFMKRVKTVNL